MIATYTDGDFSTRELMQGILTQDFLLPYPKSNTPDQILGYLKMYPF